MKGEYINAIFIPTTEITVRLLPVFFQCLHSSHFPFLPLLFHRNWESGNALLQKTMPASTKATSMQAYGLVSSASRSMQEPTCLIIHNINTDTKAYFNLPEYFFTALLKKCSVFPSFPLILTVMTSRSQNSIC